VLKAVGEIGYDGWATSEVSGPPPATAGKLEVYSGEAELADGSDKNQLVNLPSGDRSGCRGD
jgi:hypothetical protein